MSLASDCPDLDLRRLADLIHGKNCRWNHTDGCGYFYEDWDRPAWHESDRRSAYDQATRAFRLSGVNSPKELVDLIKNVDSWMAIPTKP